VISSTDPVAHAWWLASRSAGIVAWLLLTAALLGGLMMASRLVPARGRRVLALGHERLALLALATTAAHGALLLGDSYLRPGLAGILVPFVSRYRPLWTGLGIFGGYLAAALSLGYYARRRLGARRWRKAHRFIPIAWALAAAHVIGAGTDAGQLWMQIPLAATLVAGGALLGDRLLGRLEDGAARQTPGTPATPGGPAAWTSSRSASTSQTT
jgi:sulfoxide reductase heme-binding subunit YedZ